MRESRSGSKELHCVIVNPHFNIAGYRQIFRGCYNSLMKTTISREKKSCFSYVLKYMHNHQSIILQPDCCARILLMDNLNQSMLIIYEYIWEYIRSTGNKNLVNHQWMYVFAFPHVVPGILGRRLVGFLLARASVSETRDVSRELVIGEIQQYIKPCRSLSSIPSNSQAFSRSPRSEHPTPPLLPILGQRALTAEAKQALKLLANFK